MHTPPKALFIGLGAMGRPMATRLARTTDLTVYDVRPDVTHDVATHTSSLPLQTISSIDAGIDVVILMVPTSAIVEDILIRQGVLDMLRPGALIVDMSSSLPSSTRDLAEAAAARSIGYVDAPVSGGVTRATSGELAIMVGGDPAACGQALPLLEQLGTNVQRVGGSGTGHAAKALNNLLSATQIAAAAEIVTAAVKLGIDADVMVDVLNNSTGRSQATEVKFPQHILPGTYNSGFRIELMVKDLRTATAILADLDTTSPVVTAGADVTQRAAGDLALTDHTEVARWYAAQSGVNYS